MNGPTGKKIVLVGHCGPDSNFLRIAVSSADKTAKVYMADDLGGLKSLITDGVDLLLINRELPYDFGNSNGVELLTWLRVEHPALKAMLISNYPDAQASAVAAGARPGFGKRELGTPLAAQRIREALTDNTPPSND